MHPAPSDPPESPSASDTDPQPQSGRPDATSDSQVPSAHVGGSLRWRRIRRRVGFGVLGLLTVLAGSAGVDAYLGRKLTQRGLMVTDLSVGRADRAEFASFLDDLQRRYDSAEITVTLPDRDTMLTGAEVGLTVDRDQLTRSAFSAGRTGGLLHRARSYLRSTTGASRLPVPVSLDQEKLRVALRSIDSDFEGRPSDPSLRLVNDRWVVDPQRPGDVPDSDEAATRIITHMRRKASPASVTVGRKRSAASYTEAELDDLVSAAKAATDVPLVVKAGTGTAIVQPTQLRRSVIADVDGLNVSLRLSGDTLRFVFGQLSIANVQARDASLTVDTVPSNDPDSPDTLKPRIIPSATGTRCCADDSGRRIATALSAPDRRDQPEPVVLDTVVVVPKVTTEQLTKLGIVEPIGTFTTKHAPGETRVKNIHRIADLLRGTIIEPGETFSVNETIGPRSRDNGFFAAGVIEQGIFKEDFGGGISQFATTLFNASFFSGLDLVEYQSHSLYISRYPYGREATLSFPAPDLKVRNNTPYAVLLWPTYTDRTITVTLLSTRYVTGTVVAQRKASSGQCTAVYTERLRTYVDGRSERDTTKALYRPSEGRDCNGQLTPAAQALERERAARAAAREAARAKRQAQQKRTTTTKPKPSASTDEASE
jgi:hypothetical protein